MGIVDGDDRSPKEIAEDLGLVGQVVVSEDVKSATNRVLASNAEVLDQCLRDDDERPLMKIVTQVMSDLNPNQRWRGDYRVGDPVCIKDLCIQALNKRRAEKAGRSTSSDNE